MTIKIVHVLVTTVALGALILGTAPSMAQTGGGGGGHGGGGRGGAAGGILVRRSGGGGGHFSAAHVSGARIGTSRVGAARVRSGHVRNFSSARSAHVRSNQVRNLSSTRTGASRNNFARVNGANVRGSGAGTLGGRRRLEPLGQFQLERRLEPRMGRLVRTSLLALLLRQSFCLCALAVRLLRPILGLRKSVRVGCHVLARSSVRLRPRVR